MVFAAIGLLAVAAATTIVLKTVGLVHFDLLRILTDSDEAPIRVRNGSLDLVLVSATQAWTPAGNSGNWNINRGRRHKDEFDVTVISRSGASCGGPSATGAEVIFTYSNDKKIRVQSVSRHTWVKPDAGVTLTRDNALPQKLSYVSGGFLKTIEIGNGSGGSTPMCTFTAPNQLAYIILLDTP
jgi:hypothetical protein